ncbi:fungal protease inhibitor-1-like [Photinus pyralis]|uniref:fungal protease inhibitor-1-like n=1 Tax=Photinus pyralis TaxID=7054 RepID=UPI00126744A7|nr:fungal protease inhibitor-1-like isoform X2 [Photinus pyralis]XP_031350810.1 fungal protease inhibitor-1-like [Photinus pyralis]
MRLCVCGKFRFFKCNYIKMDTKKVQIYILVAILFHCCDEATSIVCTPNFCDSVNCINDEVCGPNQVLKPASFCNCCKKCVTILKENQRCSSLLDSLRGFPKLHECDEGLVCINDVCRSINEQLDPIFAMF